MDFEAEARRDVDRTIQQGRDDAERGIARARLAFYGLLSVSTTVLVSIAVVRGDVTWNPADFTPAGVALAGVAYSIALLRWADRNGYRPATSEAIAAADVLAICALSLAIHRWAPRTDIAELFDRYVLALMIAIPLLLGEMRVAARFRLPLAALAVVGYLVTAHLVLSTFERPQPLAALLIAFFGVIGARNAANGRERLEQLARMQLLGRFVPAGFAAQMGSGETDLGAALAPRELTLTLLSADLRGFTAISEALAPAEVVAMLDGYHRAMLGAIDATAGMLDKFIGDGLLVVFGYPKPPADAGASAALRCAKAMLDGLESLNAARRAAGQAPLAMGIGIHTGKVIAGTIGTGARGEFTVIGDAVNTASRLEGLTKSAGAPVVISVETAQRLDGAGSAELRELPPMAVKGKAEPVRVYAMG